MKRSTGKIAKIAAAVFVLALIALAVVLLPSLQEDWQWRSAQQAGTLEAYREYVLTHAAGKHAGEAQSFIEELVWHQSTNANTVQSMENYLRSYGAGRFATEARARRAALVDALAWQGATNANTLRSLRAYAAAYPQGRFVAEAQTRQAALRVDDAPFLDALRDSVATADARKVEGAFRRFLEDFPGHAREAVVQLALNDFTEGRDVFDLLDENRIRVETQGRGIRAVGVRMKRLVPLPMMVRIPVGSYFVSANLSAQNMVATSAASVRLLTDEWTSLSVDAACANRPRDIPGGSDTFRIQRSPHQAELARLMPVLERAGVDFATRQAAVWIVTDDADYNDLGILVASSFGFGGSRTINEPETARAMKICWEAGIDITRKRIWRDRTSVWRNLRDAELKSWLAGK